MLDVDIPLLNVRGPAVLGVDHSRTILVAPGHIVGRRHKPVQGQSSIPIEDSRPRIYRVRAQLPGAAGLNVRWLAEWSARETVKRVGFIEDPVGSAHGPFVKRPPGKTHP